jgi:hypothetical protein
LSSLKVKGFHPWTHFFPWVYEGWRMKRVSFNISSHTFFSFFGSIKLKRGGGGGGSVYNLFFFEVYQIWGTRVFHLIHTKIFF